jgi:hypothetical protein
MLMLGERQAGAVDAVRTISKEASYVGSSVDLLVDRLR